MCYTDQSLRTLIPVINMNIRFATRGGHPVHRKWDPSFELTRIPFPVEAKIVAKLLQNDNELVGSDTMFDNTDESTRWDKGNPYLDSSKVVYSVLSILSSYYIDTLLQNLVAYEPILKYLRAAHFKLELVVRTGSERIRRRRRYIT